ncbi:hypothetical protein [Marinilactibacillus kalidii]|uniref:AbiJ-related protein n=1 Tax=Marinilactibacillus kalidii TaxID=2820274 RepID=UPI0031343318
MNRISELTKFDILNLFQDGIDINDVFETKKVNYPYFGRMDELDFLKRLYDLKNMPSYDPRFSNAEDDIWQHTISNDDYPNGWVFEDERFKLKNGNDENYLKFICEIFHPTVRYEKGYWRDFLHEVNKLLQQDGYELYPAAKISNRNIYDWKLYQPENAIFIPFSQRNRNEIKQHQINFTIKREARVQIYHLFEIYDYLERKISETGWQYEELVSTDVLQEIRKFYTPKCFNNERQYVETNSLEDFILFTSPYCVIDAIEFFDKYTDNIFTDEVNTMFTLKDIPLKLTNGKIKINKESHIKSATLTLIGEAGLKELLQEASGYYEKENLKIAVEKIWDAFERLKTYYSPTLDKKKSVSKIIDEISGNREPFKKLFDKEFSELTIMGNEFRIRHHETTKVDIEDARHYDYFYKRCLSLITTVLQYLDKRREI